MVKVDNNMTWVEMTQVIGVDCMPTI
jgi:hypothetical protein